MSTVPFRIGHGYDAHRFADGRTLVLGGVTIPHPRGLEGHSDADVLCHAVIDALLGAMALGDIGNHFPASDPEWRDANSLDLLSRVREKVAAAGGTPAQIDCIVYAEEPKLAPHVSAMRKHLADALELSETAVSLKATTTEGMGFVGRKEGIAATAVVMVTVGPA